MCLGEPSWHKDIRVFVRLFGGIGCCCGMPIPDLVFLGACFVSSLCGLSGFIDTNAHFLYNHCEMNSSMCVIWSVGVPSVGAFGGVPAECPPWRDVNPIPP